MRKKFYGSISLPVLLLFSNQARPSAHDHCAFVMEVARNPRDELPLMVYSDFLKENGHPEQGEWILLQIELDRLRVAKRRRSRVKALERQRWALVGDRDDEDYAQQFFVSIPSGHNPFIDSNEFVAFTISPRSPVTFMMGTPEGERKTRRRSRDHQRQVTLTRAFEMQKTLVTELQWALVMGTNPTWPPEDERSEEGCLRVDDLLIDPFRPVDCVSWNETKVFIAKLNEMEGLKAAGQPVYEYRLPTEAEWEYATRSGTQTRFYFGDDQKELGRYAWFHKNSRLGGLRHEHWTMPVGRLQPNPSGLYDTLGNLNEWVEDAYTEHLGNLPATDPVVGGDADSDRVVRGGNFFSDADECRCASRERDAPHLGSEYTGFRLARIRVR